MKYITSQIIVLFAKLIYVLDVYVECFIRFSICQKYST